MLDFEVTHGGGVHGEVASLGYKIISLEVMIYKDGYLAIPVATARADVRRKESCMADSGWLKRSLPSKWNETSGDSLFLMGNEVIRTEASQLGLFYILLSGSPRRSRPL